jgi:hypothetical protein
LVLCSACSIAESNSHLYTELASDLLNTKKWEQTKMWRWWRWWWWQWSWRVALIKNKQ